LSFPDAAGLQAKSGCTDEDEKALLGFLQKNWHSGNLGSGEEFDVISSAAESLGEQLPVTTILILPIRSLISSLLIWYLTA
jgi:hypothetical protein